MARIELALLLVLLATATAFAQAGLREVDLTIDGIGSGSPYADLLRKFGIPSKQKIEKGEAGHSCTGEAHTMLTVEYTGLQVVLLGDGNAQGFEIVEMDITSKKWNVSGVRIGDSPASVDKRFGKPNSVEQESGQMTYRYVTPDNLGNVIFEFSNGKLSRMRMAETLC